jgi:hypothetical protein
LRDFQCHFTNFLTMNYMLHLCITLLIFSQFFCATAITNRLQLQRSLKASKSCDKQFQSCLVQVLPLRGGRQVNQKKVSEDFTKTFAVSNLCAGTKISRKGIQLAFQSTTSNKGVPIHLIILYVGAHSRISSTSIILS